MSGYILKQYEKTLDSKDYPDLNQPQFGSLVAQERDKLGNTLAALKCEFVAQFNLSGLGLACRFVDVNGCPAIREVTGYDKDTKSIYVQFSAVALIPVHVKEKKQPDLKSDFDPTEAETIRRDVQAQQEARRVVEQETKQRTEALKAQP